MSAELLGSLLKADFHLDAPETLSSNIDSRFAPTNLTMTKLTKGVTCEALQIQPSGELACVLHLISYQHSPAQGNSFPV